METSILDPVKFQRLLVPENKEYKLDFKEKRLVDNSSGKWQWKECQYWWYDKLTPKGCSLTYLYGWPKIHKALVYPLPNYRAVISQNDLAAYTIAKHLFDWISSITKNKYTLKD